MDPKMCSLINSDAHRLPPSPAEQSLDARRARLGLDATVAYQGEEDETVEPVDAWWVVVVIFVFGWAMLILCWLRDHWDMPVDLEAGWVSPLMNHWTLKDFVQVVFWAAVGFVVFCLLGREALYLGGRKF